MAVAAPRKRRGKADEGPADVVTAFAKEAVKGKVALNRLAQLACQRHLDDLKDGPKRGLWFDVEEADRWIRIVESMPQRKGKWQGARIQLSGWQQFRVGCFFGWRRQGSGLRRFRKAYTEVPRGNGKTTEAAAVANGLAWFDGEPAAEVYSVSTKRDHAKICWSESKWQMEYVERSGERPLPPWKQKLGLTVLTANMHHLETASKYEPLGADKDSGDSINPHAYVFDETHSWKDREYRQKLQTALVKRDQPVEWEITTAGTKASAIWIEEHEYAVKVLEGVVEDDTYFAWISKVDDEDKWDSPEELAKANPNLGVTIQMDDLLAAARKAKAKPSELANVKRFHAGIMAESENPWILLSLWDSQPERLPLEELLGKVCYVGVDLSTKLDLTASCALFPREKDVVDVLWKFWVPEERIAERVQTDRVPYDVWVKEGWIEAIPGRVIDQDYIVDYHLKFAEEVQLQPIAADPWNAAEVKKKLEVAGIEVEEVAQVMSRLSEPTKEIERLLEVGGLCHGNNPVARWMVSNAVAIRDANDNVRLDKAKSNERIDGLAALVNAVYEWLASEADSGPSVYEERGAIIL